MEDNQLNKIVWFLVGNPQKIGSSRIHGLNVHNKLTELGYNSIIAYTPLHIEEAIPFHPDSTEKLSEILREGDVVVLQKIKNLINLPLLRFLKNLRVHLILIDCDLPLSIEIARLSDKVLCTSIELCNLYEKEGVKAQFIEDSPEKFKSPVHKKQGEKLNCYWFGEGNEERWKDVSMLREMIKNDPRLQNWKLITISNHPDSDIKWTPAFLTELVKADAIALPIFNNNKANQVKSANRLLQSMALSVPVICSPIPSYQRLVTSWQNAVICETPEEWPDALVKLEDAGVREELSENGYITATKFGIDSNIGRWIKALELEEKFKTIHPRQLKELQFKVTHFFSRQLMRRNIHYWSWEHFSLSSGLNFIYLKFMNLKKRLGNGHFLFWGR